MTALGLDGDDLAACVQCGLCLPHCPTFRVTGDESQSPRGRIALMRAVEDGAPVTDEVLRSFATCVQCRGCETACPSGVDYGRLMEGTRAALVDDLTPRWQRIALEPLRHPKVLRAGSAALARVPAVIRRRFGLPTDIPARQAPLEATGDDAWLFTGCVMDAWQRDVHAATIRVLAAAGVGVRPTGDSAGCCGALHLHAGLSDTARSMAGDVVAAIAGADPAAGGDEPAAARPVLVNSAGCGAALKDYPHLVGTDAARAFSSRVFDVHEWLADRTLPTVRPLDLRVAVQDPCHLRHVQRRHDAVRTVLAPFVAAIIELDDDGLCCGAGGQYSLLEPELAGAIRDRKVAAIDAVAPDVVVSANPGCALHLAAGGVAVEHPMTLIDRALHG